MIAKANVISRKFSCQLFFGSWNFVGDCKWYVGYVEYSPAVNLPVPIPGLGERQSETKVAQEHNTMFPVMARSRSARSGVERFNHEGTSPPQYNL